MGMLWFTVCDPSIFQITYCQLHLSSCTTIISSNLPSINPFHRSINPSIHHSTRFPIDQRNQRFHLSFHHIIPHKSPPFNNQLMYLPVWPPIVLSLIKESSRQSIIAYIKKSVIFPRNQIITIRLVGKILIHSLRIAKEMKQRFSDQSSLVFMSPTRQCILSFVSCVVAFILLMKASPMIFGTSPNRAPSSRSPCKVYCPNAFYFFCLLTRTTSLVNHVVLSQ